MTDELFSKQHILSIDEQIRKAQVRKHNPKYRGAYLQVILAVE